MKDFGVLPCKEYSGYVRGWINTKELKHRGVDIAPFEKPKQNDKTDNIAWDDGKVIRIWTGKDGGDWGNCLIIEHIYNGYKRWSGYFHFDKIYVSVGQKVKLGQSLGKRGNTGLSSGEHLHFQLTKELSLNEVYGDSKFNNYAIDPMPYIYFDKRYNMELSPYFKEVLKPLPLYPTPVERNKDKKQVEVLIDYLFMRATPNGDKYNKYCTMGVYDILSEQDAGNYRWYLISESNGYQFWIASGGDRTKDLPIEDELEALREENKELKATILEIEKNLVEATERADTKQKQLDEIKVIASK